MRLPTDCSQLTIELWWQDKQRSALANVAAAAAAAAKIKIKKAPAEFKLVSGVTRISRQLLLLLSLLAVALANAECSLVVGVVVVSIALALVVELGGKLKSYLSRVCVSISPLVAEAASSSSFPSFSLARRTTGETVAVAVEAVEVVVVVAAEPANKTAPISESAEASNFPCKTCSISPTRCSLELAVTSQAKQAAVAVLPVCSRQLHFHLRTLTSQLSRAATTAALAHCAAHNAATFDAAITLSIFNK